MIILALYPAANWLESVDSIFAAEYSREADYSVLEDVEECAVILAALELLELSEQLANNHL